MDQAISEQSKRTLPVSWVDRIFDRMQGMYGSLWLDRWRTGETTRINARDFDTGLLNAKATWAVELAGFADKPDAIKSALEACASLKLPPTLPEFRELCRQAAVRIGNSAPQIAYTPTAEDRERQKQAAAALPGVFGEKDGLQWALKPESKYAVAAVFEEAGRGNKVLAEVREKLIADGIATVEGKILQRWANGGWVRA